MRTDVVAAEESDTVFISSSTTISGPNISTNRLSKEPKFGPFRPGPFSGYLDHGSFTSQRRPDQNPWSEGPRSLKSSTESHPSGALWRARPPSLRCLNLSIRNLAISELDSTYAKVYLYP